MVEIVWVGPGYYKVLSFAVGNQKAVQASPNRLADLPDCIWCGNPKDAELIFNPKPVQYGKRENY